MIANNLIKAWAIINKDKYEKICCSISGGSDSDVMLDIIWRCDKDNKVEYVWFDTGLEYQATKEHLTYLETKYNIKIRHYKAIKPIPVSCKKYGEPFLSKFVSQMIYGLQLHNFTWEEMSFEEMIEKGFPVYLAKWWNNRYQPARSQWNIGRNKYLKEFLIENPPTFKISSKCCDYAKKKLNSKLIKEENYDLMITGIRKAEGGIRAMSYKNCFNEKEKCDYYRPLFWYKDLDKKEYEKAYEIVHSKCYTEYGMTRTGCACCPYGTESDLELELEKINIHEPKLFNAVNHIFKNSYEYTKKYRDYYRSMKLKSE